MKNIKTLIITAVLFGTLAGCANDVDRVKITKKAEETVNDFFDAVKNNDISKAATMVDDDDRRDYQNFGYEEERAERFKTFDYKIVSSEKVDDDTVYVNVEITSPESLNVNVEVEEDDGRWRIDSDRNLLKAVFGDLYIMSQKTPAV